MVTGRSRGPVRGLVVASHFPPTVMVTAFALALSAGIGAGARTTTLVALAVLTGQLSVGWSNDWLDARRDVAVGRADKPVVTGLVTAATLRAAALVALGACVVLSLATGPLPGAVHVVAVGVAWSYNALLKATWWSWAPYAVSFGLLAVFVVLAAPGRAAPPRGPSRPPRCSASARTSRTRCPTSRTTPPRACAACRTGSGAARAPFSRPCCSPRRPRSS